MTLKIEKIKSGTNAGSIKIYDENNGYIIITKQQAASLANVLSAATK